MIKSSIIRGIYHILIIFQCMAMFYEFTDMHHFAHCGFALTMFLHGSSVTAYFFYIIFLLCDDFVARVLCELTEVRFPCIAYDCTFLISSTC